jgi:hypothetical protein
MATKGAAMLMRGLWLSAVLGCVQELRRNALRLLRPTNNISWQNYGSIHKEKTPFQTGTGCIKYAIASKAPCAWSEQPSCGPSGKKDTTSLAKKQQFFSPR